MAEDAVLEGSVLARGASIKDVGRGIVLVCDVTVENKWFAACDELIDAVDGDVMPAVDDQLIVAEDGEVTAAAIAAVVFALRPRLRILSAMRAAVVLLAPPSFFLSASSLSPPTTTVAEAEIFDGTVFPTLSFSGFPVNVRWVEEDADEEEDVGEEEVASHTDLTLEEVASVKHRLRRA